MEVVEGEAGSKRTKYNENTGPNLRARLTRENEKKIQERVKDKRNPSKKKPSTELVAFKSTPKAVRCTDVEIGSVVLCKMRGFAEWPALVTGFTKNLIEIIFFGDQTTHIAAISNIFSFEESHELLIHNLKKKNGIGKVVRKSNP